jgi:hypothetical protein
MSLDAYHHLIGGAIAAGAVVGALVAFVNSWRV